MFTLLIALGNLSILEIPQEYAFFYHTPTPGFFLLPFCLDIIFGVLCRSLQSCQSFVFDGVIGVHRGFYHFFYLLSSATARASLPSTVIQIS